MALTGVGGDVRWDPSRSMYVDRSGNRVNEDGSVYANPAFDAGSHQYQGQTGTWLPKEPVHTMAPSGGAVAPSRPGAAGVGGDGGGYGSLSLDALLGEVDKVNGPYAPPPSPVYNPVNAPGRVQHASANPGAVTAASNAAYASAKDRIGLSGRASLDALRDEFSGRGLGGSLLEGKATADLISGTSSELGKVARDQSAADLARMNAVSDQTYSGDLAQRITDTGVAETNSNMPYQGAITTRGQDINAATANAASRRSSLDALAKLHQAGVLY